MKYIIDGIVFSLQQQGGISVYFKELLDFLNLNQAPTTLLLDGTLKKDLISTNSSCVTAIHRPARIIERYRPCRMPYGKAVFHSSYYRLPSNRCLPTVVTVHDFIYERYQQGPRLWVHRAQKNAAIRSAQAVICVSESTKQDLLEFVGETPGQVIYVIHNGVSNVFRNLGLEASKTPFVLFVGQRAGYKNFQLALKAMVFLPDLEIHCVGGGAIHPDELKDIPESVAARVRHLGFVSDEELNTLYNCALCLVYPSSYEGFGIPVIEAMRAGCPVVSTGCKAVLEVAPEALTVVSDLDPRTMADAILKTSSSDRRSLIQKGLTVAQGYSWEATHRKTLAVYRSLSA
jgi:mannosyltransferase